MAKDVVPHFAARDRDATWPCMPAEHVVGEGIPQDYGFGDLPRVRTLAGSSASGDATSLRDAGMDGAPLRRRRGF